MLIFNIIIIISAFVKIEITLFSFEPAIFFFFCSFRLLTTFWREYSLINYRGDFWRGISFGPAMRVEKIIFFPLFHCTFLINNGRETGKKGIFEVFVENRFYFLVVIRWQIIVETWIFHRIFGIFYTRYSIRNILGYFINDRGFFFFSVFICFFDFVNMFEYNKVLSCRSYGNIKISKIFSHCFFIFITSLKI